MFARLLSALLVFSSAPALAAGDPDAAKGLLVEYCADCHALPDHPAPATGLPAPSFTTIATDPEVYTDARVRASLEKPHWPMGGLILSPSDIANILAYLASLGHR